MPPPETASKGYNVCYGNGNNTTIILQLSRLLHIASSLEIVAFEKPEDFVERGREETNKKCVVWCQGRGEQPWPSLGERFMLLSAVTAHKLDAMSDSVMRNKNEHDKIHAEQTSQAKDRVAVPLNVQPHLCGVKATATHFARPHALGVVVQPLNHLLLVHVNSVTRCGIITAREGAGAYKELMISHIGFSLFLCVSFQS